MIATEHDPTSEQENFGPYEVYERLGVGGMATVHRAKERGIEGFERIVALKRLLPHLAEDTSFVTAFVREARLASHLQHAHIVQLYELGRVGSVLFISMEYIEGRDVRAILRQARKVTGAAPLSVFLALMSQLCDALDYAHHRSDQNGEPLGIVHRDVSPSNLLVSPSGHLKVIDFGIAKAQTQQLRTETGRVKGKLAYMAPEALKGHELDARSDIFSVGVVAHELLTARPLFAARNEYETLSRLQELEIEPPSTYNRKCPPELDEIVLRALERNPARRWESAAALRDALHQLTARYQVRSTNREVASWLEWAFALQAPQTGTFAAISSGSIARGRSGSYPSVSPAHAFARASSSITPSGGITPLTDPGSDAMPLPPPPGGPLALDGSTGGNPASPASPAGGDTSRGDEVSDEAVSFAWGDDERKQQAAPIVLDDVPDVSVKMKSAQPSQTSRAPSHSERSRASSQTERSRAASQSEPQEVALAESTIEDVLEVTNRYAMASDEENRPHVAVTHGSAAMAAVMVPNPPRRRSMMIALGGVVLVAVVLAMVLMRGGSETPGQSPSAAAAIPPTAGIKFLVAPKDVVISVSGHDEHLGAPYKLTVDAPATYRVSVTRPGYKSFVTEIAVEAGESHVVRLTLEAAENEQSKVTIKLDREDVSVYLDGEEVPHAVPLVADVDPGAHVLVVRDSQGNELWQQDLDAEARTNYEFEPILERKVHRRLRGNEAQAAETTHVLMPNEPVEAEPRASDESGDEASSSGSGSGSGLPTNPSADLALARVGGTEPPLAPRVKSHGPVTILASDVVKRAGALPPISAALRDVPDRASAKICIDTRGRVISAEVLTRVNDDVRDDLVSALRDWRYAPYTSDGEAREACFALNFRIEKSGR